MSGLPSEIRSLVLVTVLGLLHFTLQFSTRVLFGIVLLLLTISNVHNILRLSMRSVVVRRLVHRYIAWSLVSFRIKFMNGYSWYSEVDKTVILGALPIPENVPSLKRAKVRLIITLCEPFELEPIYTEQEFKDMGFVNKRFSIPDVFGAPEIQDLVEILKSISETEKSGYRTYVHCKAGRGRSASTVLCYLMFRYNVSVEWALTLLKRQRFEVSPKPQQLLRVREFREKFQNIPELKEVTFKASEDCALLDGAKYRFAFRHITERRNSMPNCTSIVNYRQKFGLLDPLDPSRLAAMAEEKTAKLEATEKRRRLPVRRSITR